MVLTQNMYQDSGYNITNPKSLLLYIVRRVKKLPNYTDNYYKYAAQIKQYNIAQIVP